MNKGDIVYVHDWSYMERVDTLDILSETKGDDAYISDEPWKRQGENALLEVIQTDCNYYTSRSMSKYRLDIVIKSTCGKMFRTSSNMVKRAAYKKEEKVESTSTNSMYLLLG